MVFDVDGTLYDQKRLRRYMLIELLGYVATHKDGVRVMRTLKTFRRHREELADREATGIHTAQFDLPGWPPDKAGMVRDLVDEWMRRRPLKYLLRCRFPGIKDLFVSLKRSGILVATLSDYTATAKLDALDLVPDVEVTAEDAMVDRLKPHPKGLHNLLTSTGIPANQAIVIGDRDERDAECARRAGVAYLLKVEKPEDDATRLASFADFHQAIHHLGFT
ncbi:MAG TPA: HAD-IA family hydrolase [Stellaceae bacterium]|nr:HAD-IA family hydrolase [Stellaceae bacterium]